MRALVLLPLLATGCFLELRAGYYPAVGTTVVAASGATEGAADEATEGALLVGAYVGFRVDLFGVAISAAPSGAGGSTPAALALLDGSPQLQGDAYRVDVDLPLRALADGLLRPRATIGYDRYDSFNFHPGDGGSSTDHDNGEGSGWFGGLSLAAGGGFYSVALGASRLAFTGALPDRRFTVEGWGAEVRVMIAGWFPSFFQHYRGGGASRAPTQSYQTCFRRWSYYGFSCF